MFASSEERGVSELSVHDRQSESLPCISEKVELDLGQQISTFFAADMITEIMKRVAMRNVNNFVALLAPIGRFPCSFRPLIDTALDLTTTSTARQHSVRS